MKHSHTSPEAAVRDGLATGYRYWFNHSIAFSRQPYPRGCFPSGFMISSAEDLGHWLIAHMNNGLYHGTAVISSNGMAILHRPDLNNYAMGWEVRPDALEHGGHLSCFGSYLTAPALPLLRPLSCARRENICVCCKRPGSSSSCLTVWGRR